MIRRELNCGLRNRGLQIETGQISSSIFLLRFVPRSLNITKLVMVYISVPWTNYGIVYCHMYMSICLNKWTWLENTTNITPILLIAVKLVLLDLLWLTDWRRRTIPVKYDCHQNIHDGLFCCYLSENTIIRIVLWDYLAPIKLLSIVATINTPVGPINRWCLLRAICYRRQISWSLLKP